jgi:GT2 family glycosyltransferase
MKLSLVVLNYRQKNLVKYFLKKVVTFSLPFQWEIIVVDNNSGDGMEEVLRRDYPVVKFVQSSKNLGMGGGNNLGIKKSRGEYILVVNPDVTLNQAALLSLVGFLDEHRSAGIVAPRISNPDGSLQTSCYHWPRFSTFIYRRTFLGRTAAGRRHLNNYTYHVSELNYPVRVDWVLGGCFLARRPALQQVGLFDERFFLFLEDTDLCRRMWRAGWQVWYLPQAQVIHLPHRLSSGQGNIKDIFSRLTWIHLTSWIKYFFKWGFKA